MDVHMMDEKLHREGDKPALTDKFGTRFWYRHGKPWRADDKPTVEYFTGILKWLNEEGELHREGDKPAMTYPDGTEYYYLNGKRHRAVLGPDFKALPALCNSPHGYTEYYYEDQKYDQQTLTQMLIDGPSFKRKYDTLSEVDVKTVKKYIQASRQLEEQVLAAQDKQKQELEVLRAEQTKQFNDTTLNHVSFHNSNSRRELAETNRGYSFSKHGYRVFFTNKQKQISPLFYCGLKS